MEQKITSEKKRELELKKSMLNFKMFSLMKKQLFSLVIGLALIVIAGTSAKAQDGLTIPTAVWHLANSDEAVSVTNHAAFTYAWTIVSVACDGTESAAVDASFADPAVNPAEINYGPDAAGIYRITVTEIDPQGCNTTREFFTAIMTLDVAVTASDNLGAALAVADLATCNDYTATNGSALTPTTLVPNTVNGGADLATYRDDAYFNTRYVNVALSVSNNTFCVTNVPLASTLPWVFDYTIAGTLYDATDNFISFSSSDADAVISAPTANTGDITVAAGTTSFVLTLLSNIQWSTTDTDADEIFTFEASNVVVDGNGGEATLQQANNTSAAQTIYASPATSVISN